MPLPINVLAAPGLHAIEVGPFLGAQVAVGSHPPFRTPDMRLLPLQTPAFSGGQLPGSLSLLDSLLLVLLTLVYPTTWRRSRVPPRCLGNRLGRLVAADSGVAGISVGPGLIVRLNRLGTGPAYPGIIGACLGTPVGCVAPTAAIPISPTTRIRPHASRNSQDAR